MSIEASTANAILRVIRLPDQSSTGMQRNWAVPLDDLSVGGGAAVSPSYKDWISRGGVD